MYVRGITNRSRPTTLYPRRVSRPQGPGKNAKRVTAETRFEVKESGRGDSPGGLIAGTAEVDCNRPAPKTKMSPGHREGRRRPWLAPQGAHECAPRPRPRGSRGRSNEPPKLTNKYRDGKGACPRPTAAPLGWPRPAAHDAQASGYTLRRVHRAVADPPHCRMTSAYTPTYALDARRDLRSNTPSPEHKRCPW